MKICKEYRGYEAGNGVYLIHTNCADIGVCFVTDEIVRVRVSFDKEMAEESYILSTTAWEDRLDGLFAGERTRKEPAPAVVEETAESLEFTTPALRLSMQKDPLCFKLYDGEEMCIRDRSK